MQVAFILLATWHFVCWAPIAYSCEHVVFWWPHGVLVSMQDFFWVAAGICFAGHVSSCWARGIFLVATCHLAGHLAFLLVGTWHLAGHPVFIFLGT